MTSFGRALGGVTNLVFRVKVAIASPDGRVKPNMPADAVIATD
jgi:hypothetical protein